MDTIHAGMDHFCQVAMTGYTAAMPTMTKDEVISHLSRYTGSFPREAVKAAQEIWDEIADDMLAALRHAADNPVELVEDTGASLHTYAMYLCAEKRETRALDPFLRMMSYSDQRTLDVLLGDTLTEAGGRIIASLFAGDLQPIYQLVENRDAYDLSRGQAVRSLSVLVANGALERDTVIAYLRELFEGRIEREPSAVWNEVAEAAAALAGGELHSEVEQAFEDELVDFLFDVPESILADVDRDVDLLSGSEVRFEKSNRRSAATLRVRAGAAASTKNAAVGKRGGENYHTLAHRRAPR